MFDPYAQMNPWLYGTYGTIPSYGVAPHQTFPIQSGLGFGWSSPYFVPQTQVGFGTISPFAQGAAFAPPIAPQAWYGNPLFSNPALQQLAQQIPQLVQNAHQIAQQAPQLVHQLPLLIQQNPQLVQQAPQVQQVPQLLQQAAILAQQIPHVLQALCTSPQTGALGVGPLFGTAGGFRPFAFGPTVYS